MSDEYRDRYLPSGCTEPLLPKTVEEAAVRDYEWGRNPHHNNDAPSWVRDTYNDAFNNAKDK